MITIKFRQYDPDTGKFHYWGYIGGGFHNPLANKFNLDSDQFTGLTDKNGKEIYEGDIVKHCNTKEYNSLHQQKQLFKVVWVKENFSKDICDGKDDIFMETGFKFKKLFDGLSTVFCPEKDLEVIGNIYENPDLLKS